MTEEGLRAPWRTQQHDLTYEYKQVDTGTFQPGVTERVYSEWVQVRLPSGHWDVHRKSKVQRCPGQDVHFGNRATEIGS